MYAVSFCEHCGGRKDTSVGPGGWFTSHHDAKLAVFDDLEAFYASPPALGPRPDRTPTVLPGV